METTNQINSQMVVVPGCKLGLRTAEVELSVLIPEARDMWRIEMNLVIQVDVFRWVLH